MKYKYSILKYFLFPIVIAFYYAEANAQIGALIWSDEFNTLNSETWNPISGNGCEIGLCGWGNAELEYYAPENLSIEPVEGESNNYALVITAREETVGTNRFTSGKIDTDGKLSIQYGMIEVRIKTPNLNTGLWPAAWLLGTSNLSWPAKGEIDIMEMGHGAKDREFQGFPSADINSYVGANAIFANDDGSVGMIAFDTNYNKPYVATTPMTDRFVIYRLYWSSTEMRYTLIDNGVEHDLYEAPLPIDTDGVTKPFTKPFFFLLNMAVGGNFTDASNPDEVTATLPSKMYVDYLRIYEYNNQGNVVFDYDILEEESGTYGIYTESLNTEDQLMFGSDAEIFIWNNLTNNEINVNEGNEALAWQSINSNDWYGVSITTLYGKNMSNYVDNGYLKFDIKIPENIGFKIGISDNYTNTSFIEFPVGESIYGLVRNGEWQSVEIPLQDFAGAIAFQDMNNMFSIASIDADLPNNTFELAIDNVYWTENTEDTLSTNSFEYSPASDTGIYPIPADDLVNIIIPKTNTYTTVQVTDLAGRLVKNEITIGNRILKLKINDLRSGFYMVKLFNDNKETKLYKLIKQ